MANNSIIIRPLGAMVEALSRFGEQLYKPPSDTIRGVNPDTWYSPLQPVLPIAPEGTEPRGFQYWAGQNLLWTPRADAEYTAADLKQLAQYPLARICIENIKDLVSESRWEIQLKAQPGMTKKDLAEKSKGDATLAKLSRFWERPDREHNWSEWIRPLLDDLLVIDAACILIRKTFNGEIVELPVLRGDSIVRYIDVNGFTPMPPQPAYAQNWWGIPLVNLSTDQLIYKPRNIVPRNTVSSQLYGMSPTEQLAPEIKIGMQRLEFTLAYYTEGSTPGVVQVVPKGTTPAKIQEAMEWMNSELSGNLAARRQWRLVQGFNEDGKADQIEFTKEPLLADQFDEMHIRKICFGYGTSPQRLMKMMNRASSQQMDESADIEGLRPWIQWVKGVIDFIIQAKMGLPGYEITFDLSKEPDPVKQSESLTNYSSKGGITLNELRNKIGEEPSSAPEADQLGIVTGAGWVPLGMATATAGAETDASGNITVTGDGQGNKGTGDGKDGKGKNGKDGAGDGGNSSGAGPSAAGAESKTGKVGKPNGSGHSPTNGGGTGLTKSHCATHSQYDDNCIECSRLEIRRLEKQVPPPQPVRAITEGAIVPNPKGPIGFCSGATLNSEPVPVRGWLHTVPDMGDLDSLEKQHKYASTQIDVPSMHVPLILDLNRELIPDADLMSHDRELQPHITVRYGVVDDADQLRTILANFKPFQVVLGQTHVFEPSTHSEGACPVVVDVRSDELLRLNAAVDAAMAEKSNDFEYRPHLTLAYVKPEVADQYKDKDDFRGIAFTVRAIVLSSKDDVMTECLLAEAHKSEGEVSKFYHPHQRPRAIIHPGRLTPQSHLATYDLHRVLHNTFAKFHRITLEELSAALIKLAKADDLPSDSQDDILRRILKRLAPEWLSLPDELALPYESATLSGAIEGALQIDVTDEGMLATINSVARDWARERAAELVGMRRTVDGALVPNPDAQWAISESTRDKLRSVVSSAFETESPTPSQLDMLIQGSGIYDDSRATMISRTEIARAQSAGNLTAWSESGLVQTVEWEISGDHDHDDDCDENESNSPFAIDDVPDHPAHPNCECVLIAGEILDADSGGDTASEEF